METTLRIRTKRIALPTNIKVRDVTVNNITVIKEDSLKTDHNLQNWKAS